MEVYGELKNVVLWKTQITFNEAFTIRKSPLFKYRGRKWYLQGGQDDYDHVFCRILLEGEQKRHDPFYVECYAAEQDAEMDGNFISNPRTKVEELQVCARIFFTRMLFLENKIKYFRSHGKISFMLIFRDVDECIPSNLQSNVADKSVQTNLDLELENLSQSFSSLLENEDLPDVQLKCGDCVIPVHKSVLAARSLVFLAMFRNRMKEEISGVVDIPDVEIPVLKLFLKALYSGKVPDMSDDIVSKLYTVCDKYAVLSLRKLCSERMVNCLSQENHLNYLLLADAHNDQDLKNSVISFICEHPEFLWLDSWTRFSDEHPKLAISVYWMRLAKVDPYHGRHRNK